LARPNATLVLSGTEQVLLSEQMVTQPLGRFAAQALVASVSATAPSRPRRKAACKLKDLRCIVLLYLS